MGYKPLKAKINAENFFLLENLPIIEWYDDSRLSMTLSMLLNEYIWKI